MPKKASIQSQETTSPSWILLRHSIQSWRRGTPPSSECSDGWLRSDEWTSSRRYPRWPPKWHCHRRATSTLSCTCLVFYESTTTHGWRTTRRTPPSTWMLSNLVTGFFFYRNVDESIPSNMPEPCRKEFHLKFMSTAITVRARASLSSWTLHSCSGSQSNMPR